MVSSDRTLWADRNMSVEETAPTCSSLVRLLASPAPSSRVMVRWWWFGSSNTEKDIDQQLDSMLKAGIGGVELSYVYPVSPKQPTTFGSSRFLELIRYASDGAKKRDMRFDLTIGSGWSFGGAHVSPQLAAHRLRFEKRAVGPGAQSHSLGGRWPGDALVAAWICEGAAGEETTAYSPLKITTDVVEVPQGGAPRTLLLATSGPTTQQLKRASNGTEGPVLDHYSREASLHHLQAVGKPFLEAAGGGGMVSSVFCDSLEVYSSDWSPSIFPEFQKRRGYDPIPFLYHLNTGRPEGFNFRADYYRTLSEVFEENCLAVCLEWAHQLGTKFRVQNYGQPPCRLGGFKYADMIEGEAWGWLRIPQTKWAASAAHHLAVKVVSSETWTWLNSPSFKARPLDFKGEAHEHVLCGINAFIGHGWPSSPLDIVDPGWAFYASCAITDRNAWWNAASVPMFAYLQRLAEVMRHGESVCDIGLWMPYEDAYAGFENGEAGEELNLWRASARRVGEIPRMLRQSGYDFDCLDGELPVDSISKRHSVVVIAGSTSLSPIDQDLLNQVAANGTRLVVVESDLLPEATHVHLHDLIATIRGIVQPDLMTGDPDIGFVHHRLTDGELYFVANTAPGPRTARVRPRAQYSSWQRWDMHEGTSVSGTGEISIELAAYEAVVYVTSTQETSGSTAATLRPLAKGLSLNEWTLRLPDGASEKVKIPNALSHDEDFVGTVTYTTSFDLSAGSPSRLCLDYTTLPTPSRSARREQSYEAHSADPVGVVADVIVNGAPAGVLWDPPYEIDIGHLLKAGKNTIELAVSTTSMPGLRSPEWIQIWKDAEQAHGRRFIMQEIEYAFQPMRSGLLVVPELR